MPRTRNTETVKRKTKKSETVHERKKRNLKGTWKRKSLDLQDENRKSRKKSAGLRADPRGNPVVRGQSRKRGPRLKSRRKTQTVTNVPDVGHGRERSRRGGRDLSPEAEPDLDRCADHRVAPRLERARSGERPETRDLAPSADAAPMRS